MKLAGAYAFEAPLEAVWQGLFDPEVLARTLPGCDKLERRGDQFIGEINVKMGPVQGKFQGKVDIQDVKDRESYTMIVDGRGPAGFAKATARIRVAPDGSGTRLEYDSDVQVGGRIASVGQRLIDASSRAILKQSLEGLHDQIKARAARAPAPAALPAVAPPPAPGVLEASRSATADPLPVPVAAGLEGAASLPPAPMPRAPLPSATPLPPAPLHGAPSPAGVASTPAGVAAPRDLSRAPSQASFVFGVAREIVKEMLPARTVAIVVALLVAAWIAYRLVFAS